MIVTRLQHLITILQAVEPRQLRMKLWFSELRHGQPACGTAACAIGHACLDPEFNKQGLSIWEGRPAVSPNEFSWSAVTKFFDLTTDQAGYLFDESCYNPFGREDGPEPGDITPALVIERIKDLLESQP